MAKRLGIFGYPLAHSLSPVLQQAAFDYHNIDAAYETWPVSSEQLCKEVDKLRGPDYLGANVTIPHKEAVLELLDDVTQTAASIGAVNTIVKRGSSLVGHNSDAYGFIKSLNEQADFDPQDKSVLLLGAGGAARAAAFSLAETGVVSLTISNRTVARAQALANAIDLPSANVTAISNDPSSVSKIASSVDLIVNATSVGMMHGGNEATSPLQLGNLTPNTIIYDMVYTPSKTPLLQAAGDTGATCVGGLWMLIYQGAAAFELWTERPAPVGLMYETAHKALADFR